MMQMMKMSYCPERRRFLLWNDLEVRRFAPGKGAACGAPDKGGFFDDFSPFLALCWRSQ